MKYVLLISVLHFTNLYGQTSESVNQIKRLLELARDDFNNIIGTYDSALRANHSLLTVDQTKDNEIIIDTSLGISMYIAYVADSLSLSKAKRLVQEWVQATRPILVGYKETYSPKADHSYVPIYEEYHYLARNGASEHSFTIHARKSDVNKYYTVSFSISRQWKHLSPGN